MELTVRWCLHRSSYMRHRIGGSLERSLVQHAIQLSKPAITPRLWKSHVWYVDIGKSSLGHEEVTKDVLWIRDSSVGVQPRQMAIAYRQTSRWSHLLIWSKIVVLFKPILQTDPFKWSVVFLYLHRYPSLIFSASVKKMFLALIQGWNRIQSCLSTTTKSPALDSMIPIMLSMLGSQTGLAYGKDLVWFLSATISLQFNIVTHYYAGQRSSPQPSNHPSRSV
jgi:hypothetical protein